MSAVHLPLYSAPISFPTLHNGSPLTIKLQADFLVAPLCTPCEASRSSPRRQPPLPSSSTVEINSTNVYISNLPKDISDAWFEQLVSQHGRIFSFKLVHKDTYGPPIGFVQYVSPESARESVAALDGRAVLGSVLRVKLALRDKDKGASAKPSANLYICNLPSGFSQEQLRRLFERFGRIVSLVTLSNVVTGPDRCTGFVRFSSVREARVAKETMHGAQVHPLLPLEVKFAESNAERTQRMRTRRQAADLPAAAGLKPPLSPDAKPADMIVPRRRRPAPLQAPGNEAKDTPSLSPSLLIPMPTPLLDVDIDALTEHAFLTPLEFQDNNSHGPDGRWMPSAASDVQSDSVGRKGVGCDASVLWKGNPLGWEMMLGDQNHQPLHLSAAGALAPQSETETEDHRSSGPTSPASTVGPVTSTTVCLENLPPDVGELEAYQLGAPFGAIVQVNVCASDSSASPVAFIQYRDLEDAQTAQAALNGMSYRRRTLRTTV